MEGENIKNQSSESFLLAILLTFVGGFLDAYTYCCRGGVFANAQTGNIVKVGMTLANGMYFKTIRYFIPIVTFVIGIFVVMLIRDKCRETHFHWRQLILMIESFLVVIVSFIPMQTYLNILVNIMVSFLCAIQAESFKKILGKPFSSTMCTGNLKSGSEYLYQVIKNHDRSYLRNVKYYVTIIISFILGVMISVYISTVLFEKSILVVLIPLSCSILYMKNEDYKHYTNHMIMRKPKLE